MAGFYRSGYTTVDGETRVMASTQFEALDARRCFPCWDEPARKAVFQVTIDEQQLLFKVVVTVGDWCIFCFCVSFLRVARYRFGRFCCFVLHTMYR